jgi:hypothetical protein
MHCGFQEIVFKFQNLFYKASCFTLFCVVQDRNWNYCLIYEIKLLFKSAIVKF